MGNSVRNAKAGMLYVKFTNGGMEVFTDLLSLSMSHLASNSWQRRFASWIAEHDQHIFGRGCVGFDLDDIGWVPDDFEAQKEFLLSAIDLALSGYRWDFLYHNPLSPSMHDKLLRLIDVIKAFKKEYINIDNAWIFENDDYTPEKCTIHDVYMWERGCVICHNELDL